MEGRSEAAAGYGKLRASARVVTEIKNLTPLVGDDLRRERARTSAQVKRCARCGLRPSPDTGELPVPFTGAHRGACEQVNTQSQADTITGAGMVGCSIIGEAPGREEMAAGKPFMGRSGKLLRALITEAGFDWNETCRMNVVCCWPKADGRTRGPTDKEMLACRKNLDRQLEVASWSNVLLVGGYALKAFRSDLKITHVQGGVFVWRGSYVVMPVFHPAAILRDKTLRKPTQESLSFWYRIVSGQESWLNGLKRSCIRCGGLADRYDTDMVPYCTRHYDQWGMKVWQKEQKKWDNRPQTTTLDL